MDIKEMMKECHKNAVRGGFHDCPTCRGTGEIEDLSIYLGCDVKKCHYCKGTGVNPALKMEVYYKVIEELEEFHGAEPSDTFDKDSEQSEICDIIFVLLAYAESKKYDMERAMKEKIEFNKGRVYETE